MGKKTILHLITGLNVGGAEKALANNLPYLTEFDHIVCSLSCNGPIGDDLRQRNFKVYVLRGGKWFSPTAIYQFYKIIKNEEPAALVTYLIHADLFGRIFGRLFGIKKIACFLRSSLDDPKYRLFFWLERFTSFLTDNYLAVSETVRQTYVQRAKINPEKISVIPTGIDLKRFSGTDSGQVKKNLGIDDRLVLTCVAQLRPEKNHLLLLETFRQLAQKRPDAMLLLAGEGPMRKQIQDFINKNNLADKVRLLGQRQDVPQILCATDIFVLLSSYEGISNALLEAMAAGCTIIASDIPPNRELITNEKNGLLVPLENKYKILDSLKSLTDNQSLRNQIRQNNLNDIKKFSLQNTAKFLRANLTGLVNNR